MQRTFLSFSPSFSLFLFCRVMWIIINVNPNMMHIFFFFFKCLGLLYLLFSFQGGRGGGVMYPETATIRIEIYFCY